MKNQLLKNTSLALLLIFLVKNWGISQQKLLQSGPMVGYVEMFEVMLWAQTKQAARVHFEYWDAENPSVKMKTDPVFTEKMKGFTAKCVADQVQPGRKYVYRLFINKKPVKLPYPTYFKTQTLWQWRTDPPEFTVAAGSCFYVNETEFDRPGKPYGSDYQIVKHIDEKNPDLMIWLGDNTYLREPDWSTRTGVLHRHTHSRSLPELQPLLARTAHYATWDDHDFGPNDSDGTWVHKELSHEIFSYFWGNPTFGVEGQKGVTTFFKYADIDFFLLDNRYFRSPNDCQTCPRTALGDTQLKWFLQALAASRAPFKIVAVGGQFLTNKMTHESFAHYSGLDRDTILKHIDREKIKNVVFLTGDVHFGELSEMTTPGGIKIYDLTTSPLTAGAYADGPTKEKNDFRVPGTGLGEHNFAVMKFSGKRTERRLEIKVYDANGLEKWSRVLGN